MLREPLPHPGSRGPEVESPSPAARHRRRAQEEAVSRSFTPMPRRRSEDSPLRSAERPRFTRSTAVDLDWRARRDLQQRSRAVSWLGPHYRPKTVSDVRRSPTHHGRALHGGRPFERPRDGAGVEPATPNSSFGALPTELAIWQKLDLRAGFESAAELAGSRVSPPAAVRPGTHLPSSRRFHSGQYRSHRTGKQKSLPRIAPRKARRVETQCERTLESGLRDLSDDPPRASLRRAEIRLSEDVPQIGLAR